MRGTAELKDAYAAAARATAAGSKSFYFASRFFPREMARHAHAVYWFCRFTDDLVDECAHVHQGRRDLDEWTEVVWRGLSSGASDHPVLRAFLDACSERAIPQDYPLELIDGMRMDLDCVRYETFEDLRLYCYRVASVVGLMMSHVIGFEDGALERAVDLGIAMQLTNILRDVGEDADRGRVYLPSQELARFGYSEAALRARVRSDAFFELMRFQAERAREYYRRAMPGIDLLDRRGRFAVRIAADVYRGILRRIESMDYDVFHRRAVVPTAAKWWITARAVAWSR